MKTKHTLKLLVAAVAVFVLHPAIASEDFETFTGVDLYGRSYHHALKPGVRSRVNESNVGFGLYAGRQYGDNRIMIDGGAFENSSYDQAYWVGMKYTYRLAKYLEVGFIARNWQTSQDSYPTKPLSFYRYVTIPVTEKIRVEAFGSGRGFVASVGLDF